MNPSHLKLRNVRRFASLDLDLPAARTAILGQNGAGKSTILDSIEVALFGGDLAAMLSIDATLPELEIELAFEHHGTEYRVRRGYSARGARGKATLDFERAADFDPDMHLSGMEQPWEPLTRETIAATQELICDTLRLTRQTYRASAYLAQGDGAAFTEAKPAERKQILADVLALADYDHLLVRARAEKNRLEGAIATTRLRIDQADAELAAGQHIAGDLERLQADLAAARERHASLEVQLAAAAEQVAAKRDAQVRHESARATLEAAERALSEAQRRRDELERQVDAIRDALAERDDLAILASELDALEEQHAELADAERSYRVALQAKQGFEQQLQRAKARHASLVVEVDRAADQREAAAVARLRAEQAEAPTCSECGQLVADEARERMLWAMHQRITDLDTRIVDAGRAASDAAADVERAEAELNAISIKPVKIGELEAARQRVGAARAAQRRLAELDAQAARLAELERDLVFQRDEALPLRERGVVDAAAEAERQAAAAAGYDETRRAHALLEHDARETGTLVTETASRVARLEAQRDRLADVERQADEQRASITTHQTELDVALALERAFGRDGIPTMIVENAAIPQIEAEANRILSELDTVYSVELRTQKALKSGDGVRETLEISVQTPDGERPYESFSGGEKTRLNLSLRIALARLLAHRRGAEIRLLAIDEPDGLDAAGAERLAQVLDTLRDDFDRILLVSHQEALRDAFDETIHVVGGAATGEPSTIASGDLEAESVVVAP